MTKHKHLKQKFRGQDREDNKKFLAVLGIATVLLMLLMYFVFTR